MGFQLDKPLKTGFYRMSTEPTITNMTNLILHRGNLIQNIKRAWLKGITAVECDARVTKDKKIVLNHGRKFQKKSIKLTPFSELNGLDLLSDAVDTIPGECRLLVEIKCELEILQPLEDMIGQKCLTNRSISFFGFIDNEDRIGIMKTLSGKLDNFEVSANFGRKKGGELNRLQSMEDMELINHLIAQARTAHAKGIVVRDSLIRQGLFEKAKSKGLKVYVWDTQYEKLKDNSNTSYAQYDGIITDIPLVNP